MGFQGHFMRFTRFWRHSRSFPWGFNVFMGLMSFQEVPDSFIDVPLGFQERFRSFQGILGVIHEISEVLQAVSVDPRGFHGRAMGIQRRHRVL